MFRDTLLQTGVTRKTGLTGGTVALALSDVLNSLIDLQGTLTSNLVVNFPPVPAGYGPISNADGCFYVIKNGTTGGSAGALYTCTVNGPGAAGSGVQGTGLVIQQGRSVMVRVDASGNLALAINDPSSGGAAGIQGLNILTDGATITPDMSLGNVQRWTIPAGQGAIDKAIAAPLNAVAGQEMTFIVINSSGGAYTGTITMNAVYRGATLVPGASTKARTTKWIYDGTSWFAVQGTVADE